MSSRAFGVCGAVLALSIALANGCASPMDDAAWPKARPLGRDMTAFRPAAGDHAARTVAALHPPQREPAEPLSLPHALALALLHNPDLAAFGWDVRAAEARILQASLPPNPVSSVMLENFGGSGPLSGVDASAVTVRLSQPIELAGKRPKRTDLARRRAELAGWDYEAQRLDIIVETARRFIDVLAAQRRLDIARQTLGVAEQVHQLVSDRVGAGVVSPVERDRATVRLSQERIVIQRVERQLAAARHRLVATWASTEPRFTGAVGDFDQLAAVPGHAALTPLIGQNPRIARWQDEIAEREAAIALERARAVPDVALGPGYRYLSDIDESALVFEAMVPLPLFDRNQGEILAARYALAKAKSQQRSAEVALAADLADAVNELSAAAREAEILRDQTLPAARAAFAASQQAFREGAADYLHVLDIQRTLFETERQYIDALADYHHARNETESLIAEPLPTN